MNTSAFIEPLDVWSFRGNRLFGDAGSWGQAQMPPLPSVLAGALRSALLARDGVDLQAFKDGNAVHPHVGSRDCPGPFTLTHALLARLGADGRADPLYALPADLLPAIDGRLRRLHPQRLHGALRCSQPLPLVAALPEDQSGKPGRERWLTVAGLRQWLAGAEVGAAHLCSDAELWLTEERVGVALEPERRRADDGKLFSLQALTCRPGVGLAVRVQGTTLHERLLRLGGDGRGARLVPAAIDWPEPDFAAIARAGRVRLLLTSPGIFPRDWLPTGSSEPSAAEGATFELHGVRARIVCAAVPRAQVVSGFDLARGMPKPAQRAVPAGAVYWLDRLDATPEALGKLVECGLWSEPCEDAARRAEGFNRCLLGQVGPDGPGGAWC